MKLTVNETLRWDWLRAPLRSAVCVAVACLPGMAHAQGVTTTTVQGTVYLANGQPGGGTLVVSWPAFTTAAGQLVAADRETVTIPADGFVSLNLAPNQGAMPAGEYYTAVFYMSDGSAHTQYWVVPAAAQATLAQVQAQVMPAAQAVQAVNKAYVDQAVAQALGSQLSGSGGNLTGPLYLSGDPTQPLQAADKHYVDWSFSAALPLAGGAATGPLTATQLGAAYQVDQFPGADFGAKLQACLNAVNATYGGTCDARNFTGTQSMGSNLTISTANTTVELPCATIATANQVMVTAGTRNVALRGCALRGGSAANGNLGGTVFEYSGAGPMVRVGDPAYLVDTPGFHLDNAAINTTGAASATAQGLAAYRTQEMDVESVYFLGNSNQTGMTLDGTGNYTGGTFYDDALNGFGTAVNAIGHQTANAATTDWLNASTFVRLHIDCPTSGGYPVAGTTGINLQQGDGNTFTGGDVEGCATALHLGPNAQNNTIVGLRNENSTNQVVADAGSAYNNWITGGTMFTGKLSDSGTRNSFLDTFHRSFNGMNGDWYGSQQDATVTNHVRLGIGMGNERGLQKRYQTDYGYRWTTGLSDATAGEQFYQITDELNNLNRISVGQYLTTAANSVTNVVMNNGGCYSSNAAPAVSFSGGGGSNAAGTAVMGTSKCSGGWQILSVTMTGNGSGYTSQPAVSFSGGDQVSAPNAVAEISMAGSTNDQTVLNSAGTGAVVLNGSNNAGTGGVVFGSGGPSETTVATINNAGNALFNGTLQVGGTSTFTGSAAVKNLADAEIDYILQAGASAPQKESLIYRDYNGASQWYMVKDQNNNWALNSATGNLDSFKAYQSSNSGDTYINAANPAGVVRVNYETGAGTAFNIYGGGSNALYASFSAANAIKFPGLAAPSGVDCLQIDNSGYISNTGSPCGSGSGGGSGTVESGLTGQIAYYTGNGTTVGGMSAIPVSAGGTGATSASAALGNLLPGVASDGGNGITVAGKVTPNDSISKASPEEDIRGYGAVIDGATDVGSALSSAVSACNSASGEGCKILLPCVGPHNCYLANGTILPYTPGMVLEVQGSISLGSTLVLPNRSTLECDGSAGSGNFQYRGPNCAINAPQVKGTMGTAITATGSAQDFTPTFSQGSMGNFYVNTAITVAGMQSCSASASRTAAGTGPNTTFTVSSCSDSSGDSEGARIPIGAVMTVSGCSDSSFNVSNAPVNGQDWPNGMEQIHESGATATATGCTLTGFDDNTFETEWITGVSGNTLTATFAHKHAAGDLWGMVAVALAQNTFDAHSIHGLSIWNPQGAGLWMDNLAGIDLDGVSVNVTGAMTSIAMECDGCWQGLWNQIAASIIAPGPQHCTSNCSQPSYPYGIRCSQDAGRNNGIGCSFIPMLQPTILGGIKIDGNGMPSSSGVGPGIGPLIGPTFEQVSGGAVEVDPRYGLGGPVGVSMNFGILQDDFLNNTEYFVSGTDCCVSGFADLGDLTPYGTVGSIANKYWPSGVMARNLIAGPNPASTGAFAPSTGILTDGKTIIGDFRGANAGLSPAVVPMATLPVNTSATCSTCLSATGPDGVTGSALEIQSTSSGTGAQVTAGTVSQATYAGDWIIFGAHVAPGAGLSGVIPGSGHGSNGLYGIVTSGTDTFVQGQNGGTLAIGGGLIPLSDDSWQPGITIATIANGESAAHTLNFYLFSPANAVAGQGERFYDWFWMYVPGPNNPAYTGVTQQEVARWAEELMHGYVPGGASTGTLYMSPSHKLSFGTDANLYRNGANALKTDGSLTASLLIASGLGASTAPVCPNGAGGALTTSGCTVAAGNLPAATSSAQGAVVLPSGAVANTLGTAAMQPSTAFDAAGAAASAVGGQMPGNAATATKLAANTLGCLDGWDHLPCTVYVQPPVAESSPSGSYATVWTPSAAGVYRVTGYVYGTAASSTSCSVTEYVRAQNSGQSTMYGYGVSTAQIGASISSGNGYPVLFNLAAGSAVQLESLVSSGSCTGGSWTRAVVIERLQ